MAGNWQSVGRGTNQGIASIYVDSINDKVYIGGQFYLADSIHCHGIAVWNGQNWDSVGSGLTVYQTNRSIITYKNKLYSDGGFTPNNTSNYLGRFDGVSWDTIGNGLDGSVYEMKEINDELYISGNFRNADGQFCNSLVSWNDTVFNCLSIPFEGWIGDFIYYDNQLVFGGNFFDSTSNVDLAYKDSSGFHLLGHPIYGSVSVVNSMAIYNGDLYVAGNFTTSDGNEGNNIMRWDGLQWNDVGGGTDASIWKIKVYNNELYACGPFQNAGGVITGGIAKWNGTNWSKVTNEIIQPIVADFEFYQNDIYVVGLFSNIGGVTANNVAKYVGYSDVDDIDKFEVSIYPNPSYDLLFLSFSGDAIQLKTVNIFDTFGRSQIFETNFAGIEKSIDISRFEKGVYYLELNFYKRKVIRKIIKL